MYIEVKDLTHIYSPGTNYAATALDGVSLGIEKGEFVGLIGHTGSGKSTLIQHFNSLLKPTSGEVLIDGENINADKSRLKHFRKKVGLVFQYPEHQLFEMTVFKDVSFGPANSGLTGDELRKRVVEALDAVGIGEELYETPPFELSGGQRRRIAIAGVLAIRPEILILDEPASGLDPRGRAEILGKIGEMRERFNMTVILVSHSMEDIARICGRVLVLQGGKLILDGTPTQVFSQAERLIETSLAVPDLYLLRSLLAQGGIDLPPQNTVEQMAQALHATLGGACA